MRHAPRTMTRRAMTACLLALAVACGSSSDSIPPGPTVTVTGVGWYEENIDLSNWASPPPSGETAFYDFFIHYSGDIAFTDIQYARVTAPGGYYWTINRDARLFDAASKTIGGWGRWYASQPGVLPIGPLQVEVKLTNGVTSTYTANIPAPGNLTAGSFTTMYTEDVTLPPAASAPMVKRATVGATGTVTAASQAISLTFSVNDAKVHNGHVWFYDAAGNYVAGSFYFRNPATGLVNSSLPGGLATDGTVNALSIQAADVLFQAGASLGQIARFQVVLTDGAQYGLNTSGRASFDCRSISAFGTLTQL
jgi:hypothetical protein